MKKVVKINGMTCEHCQKKYKPHWTHCQASKPRSTTKGEAVIL